MTQKQYNSVFFCSKKVFKNRKIILGILKLLIKALQFYLKVIPPKMFPWKFTEIFFVKPI